MKLWGILGIGIVCTLALFVYGQSASRCREMVQAGGSILTSSNRPITFSVRATAKGDSATGRFSFRDRQAGVSSTSLNLVEYRVLDAESRQLAFTSGTNENLVTAVVLVCDFGRGTEDAFGVVLPGYEHTSHLKRGNVVLRRIGCGRQ